MNVVDDYEIRIFDLEKENKKLKEQNKSLILAYDLLKMSIEEKE